MTNRNRNQTSSMRRLRQGLAAALLAALAIPAVAQIVAQSPLSAGGNVPGNLILTPSVEWPTLVSVANIQATYDPTVSYVGYFDPLKCYEYVYTASEAGRHFNPVGYALSPTTTRHCTDDAKHWSGNFLNWATTQTIDPFRKALTGGFRSTDTETETILQKARHSGQGANIPTSGVNLNIDIGVFPDRVLNDDTMAGNATPADSGWSSIAVRVSGLDHRMRFSHVATSLRGTTGIIAYNPASHTMAASNVGNVYELSVRVKVCVASMPEPNCQLYTGTTGSQTIWKPEGLMQKYANRMRYSVFGYLNNDGNYTLHEPHGAPMRARMKFIGRDAMTAAGNRITNPAPEWNQDTGILSTNPDSSLLAGNTATGAVPAITNSGAINYLNKFGSMTTGQHKSHDPVSEMYWAAIRYLRNQGDLAAYSTLPTTLSNARTTPDTVTAVNSQYLAADGFPVWTNWGDDPYLWSCQKSAVLGIGDVYTWTDKHLPGGTTSALNEGSATWAAEAAPGFNADTWLTRISQLEFNDTTSVATPFQGTGTCTGAGCRARANSAYIAAAAYWAHVTDIRPEATMPDKQTVSTYWVDVRENRRTEARRGNQYFLAAKYGGFQVPDDYDPAQATAALRARWTANPSWWTNSGETITSATSGGFYASETFARPDNYYAGDQASTMVSALNRAFAKIASERAGSGSSLAANSTRLDTNTRVYQAQFRNGSWFGQINAYPVNQTTGAIDTTPSWRAGTHSTLAPANWAARNIWTVNGSSGAHVQFRHANLTTTQQNALTFTGMGTLNAGDIIDYLRGNQAREESYEGGFLRTRTPPEPNWSPLLGDIVNSTPIYVGAPNPNLYPITATFQGGAGYQAWALSQATRTPALWVGANDGMMHAFHAETGAELYAFVPNASIMNRLAEYANPDYVHRYFVDGDVAVADVYYGGSWKTVLVGTMGRGGPGVFALNITNPAVPTLLWEKGTTQIPDLGRNIGRPVIAQVNDGDWRVIFGNGLDSANGDSVLVTIKLEDGTVQTNTTGDTTANGMSAVLARDTNGDGYTDSVYAGDMLGKLWKFKDIYDGDGTNDVRTAIYTAVDPSNNPQPITAAPLVGRDPSTGTIWVFFGTGQYLATTDVATTTQQTWYGIKDTGTAVIGRGTLEQRSSTAGAVIGGFQTRIMEEGTVGEMTSRDGWYYDFPASKERMVSPNRFQGSALIGTTRIPDNSNVCNPGGSGYIMAINPFTGGRLIQTFFDVNRDGNFTDADKNTDGSLISGIGLDRMPNAPIFVENVMLVSLDQGKETCPAGTFACNGTGGLRVQGSSVDVSRMFWREVVRQ